MYPFAWARLPPRDLLQRGRDHLRLLLRHNRRFCRGSGGIVERVNILEQYQDQHMECTHRPALVDTFYARAKYRLIQFNMHGGGYREMVGGGGKRRTRLKLGRYFIKTRLE